MVIDRVMVSRVKPKLGSVAKLEGRVADLESSRMKHRGQIDTELSQMDKAYRALSEWVMGDEEMLMKTHCRSRRNELGLSDHRQIITDLKREVTKCQNVENVVVGRINEINSEENEAGVLRQHVHSLAEKVGALGTDNLRLCDAIIDLRRQLVAIENSRLFSAPRWMGVL